MKNTVNILVICNHTNPSFEGLNRYAESIMYRYGCDYFRAEDYSLEDLKNNDYQQITGTCYEGLFLCGNFTLDELSWPIRRQRPRYKNIMT